MTEAFHSFSILLGSPDREKKKKNCFLNHQSKCTSCILRPEKDKISGNLETALFVYLIDLLNFVPLQHLVIYPEHKRHITTAEQVNELHMNF